ncbi:MAG: hypothetical protein N2112_09910 [Gemmataceae bacterium]|jgi:hypothetical protein|nr:hypothetical protein [Gemmataceae bacterium]
MKRCLQLFVGVTIALFAVAVSFYCAPPPNEPTVPTPVSKGGNSGLPRHQGAEDDLKLPEAAFQNALPYSEKETQEELKLPDLAQLNALPDSVKEEAININDPAFQHIKNQLKIDISLPKGDEDLAVLRASAKSQSPPTPVRAAENGPEVSAGTRPYSSRIMETFNRMPSFSEKPLPEKQNVILTNQKMLKLNLAVDQMGQSGIVQTEVHVAYSKSFSNKLVDFGLYEFWDCFPQVPKTVELCLTEDGAYLISPVFVTGVGQKSAQNQSQPVLVYLDTQKPVARISAVTVFSASRTLQMNATISDHFLDKTRTRFEYTEDGTTWKTFPEKSVQLTLSPQKNSQTDFLLTAQISLPTELKPFIFVRMIVRDQAGNETIEYYPKRIAVDMVIPKGHFSMPHTERGFWDFINRSVLLPSETQGSWWFTANK